MNPSLPQFKVGDLVQNIDHPEWGIGEVVFAALPGAWWMPRKTETDEQRLIVEYPKRGRVDHRNSDGKLKKVNQKD